MTSEEGWWTPDGGMMPDHMVAPRTGTFRLNHTGHWDVWVMEGIKPLVYLGQLHLKFHAMWPSYTFYPPTNPCVPIGVVALIGGDVWMWGALLPASTLDVHAVLKKSTPWWRSPGDLPLPDAQGRLA